MLVMMGNAFPGENWISNSSLFYKFRKSSHENLLGANCNTAMLPPASSSGYKNVPHRLEVLYFHILPGPEGILRH